MVDTVTSQTLYDGAKRTLVKYTNTSDGSGESAVKKADVSTFSGGPATMRLLSVRYSVAGMVARLLWDADTDVTLLDLQGDGFLDFREFGGIANNAGTGVTGDINITTVGASSGDSYSIILELGK